MLPGVWFKVSLTNVSDKPFVLVEMLRLLLYHDHAVLISLYVDCGRHKNHVP